MLTDDQKQKLAQDLPRDIVKTRPQSGQTLSYVPGDYVIKRLNEVFGFDGWSADPGAIHIMPGDRPVVYVQVTLRAAGVTRGDVGVGLAAKNTGDAMETAIKAAFTDGLKRCARTFGASFGLALYDKEQADVGYGFTCQELLAAYDATMTMEELDAVNARVKKAWGSLPEDERSALTGAQRAARARLAPSAPNAPADRAAQQPVTSDDALVSSVKNALSVDHLLAVLLAHGGQTSDRVWTVAVRCAGALDGTTEEQLRADIDGRKGAAKASEWGTVAAFLGDVLAATDTAGVDATVTRHGVAIKALPDRVQKLCTSTAIFHRMTLRIAGARDGDVLRQIHANLASFVQSGKLGKVQAEALTNLMNERAERLTIAAQDQAA